MLIALWLLMPFYFVDTLRLNISYSAIPLLEYVLEQQGYTPYNTSIMIGEDCTYKGWHINNRRVTLCTALDPLVSSKFSYFNE